MTCVATTQVSLKTEDLKRVFAAFPSGVTVLAAHLDGTPVGLTASSFTSVSLDLAPAQAGGADRGERAGRRPRGGEPAALPARG
jgi:flavin reductase (DIM6/NTAB) family NADH-FMN oxidoreductase RutF